VAYLHSETTSDGTKKLCVVHRDLKTKNILVKANGEACISDFGLSKTAQQDKNDSHCQVRKFLFK